jgi:pyoverdine/dityrosine biosynthesis protein Dit1
MSFFDNARLILVVGVDDGKVDAYDARLIEVYKDKYPVEEGPVPALQFKGLRDIFMSNPDSFSSFRQSWLISIDVPHPVETIRTDASELCRKLLLGVSQADRGFVRKCIEEQEPHALQLYRGQTRFMLEDLTMHPSVVRLSNKQKKKTAAIVAQEMIFRNQAYSNLVELLLPNYVRLSIHAHDNAGPKFAVRLLPKTMVRPIESLENRHEPVSAYEFQIPTPWHNSIIKVEGDELMYLARAEVAKKAVGGPAFEGSWIDGPNGGFFGLKRKTVTPEENTQVTFEDQAISILDEIIATAPLPTMVAGFNARISKDQLVARCGCRCQLS